MHIHSHIYARTYMYCSGVVVFRVGAGWFTSVQCFVNISVCTSALYQQSKAKIDVCVCMSQLMQQSLTYNKHVLAMHVCESLVTVGVAPLATDSKTCKWFI